MKADLAGQIEGMKKQAQVMVDSVFSFGELGFQEFETSKYLSGILEKEGFKVERGIAGIPTAFVATWGEGKPVISLEGTMFGKPRDRDDGLEMLARLSGQEHEVISAVALAQRGVLTSKLNRNVVRFRTLTREECETYWDSGEPRDKAGAYAIQGRAAVFIDMLRGSYSGVMGLPLFETAELLTAAGLPVWQA